MSEIKKDLFYTKDNEWIKKTNEARKVIVGISDFAQSSLGDVTYLQLPEVGTSFKKGEILGTVESVKAVSDIYAPLSGKVSRVNDTLKDTPETLNTDPYGAAWLVELEISDEAEFNTLLSPEAYSSVAQ